MMKRTLKTAVFIAALAFLGFTACKNDNAITYYDNSLDAEVQGKNSGGGSGGGGSGGDDSDVAPDAVTDLAIEAGVDNSFDITWNETKSEEIDHVDIKLYRKVDNKLVREESVAGGVKECRITDLDSGYNMICDVTAVGKNKLSSAVSEKTALAGGPFVLSYFKSDSGGNPDYESLFLAYSETGLNYTAFRENKYVFKIDKSVGSGGQCIRDAYVGRLHDFDPDDGKTTLVFMATDWTNFGSTSYGKAEYGTTGCMSYWSTSSPCIIFSKIVIDTVNGTVKFCKQDGETEGAWCERMVTLSDEAYAGRGNIQMHVWAPEMIWDYNEDGTPKPVYNDGEQDYYYGVIWSGDGNLTKSISGAQWDFIHRTYVNYTNDFTTFTGPILFYENNYTYVPVTEIDASVTRYDGKYYMFYKNEASGEKDITVAVSETLQPESWTIMHDGRYISRTTDQTKGHGLEGSWQITVDGDWWMFGDNYAAGGSPIGTKNFIGFATDKPSNPPEEWVEHNNDGTYSFPTGVRHANTCRLTTTELNIMKANLN